MESPLKMMENAFKYILKALFVAKIFRLLSWHMKKRLDKKDRVNFRIYDVTNWMKQTITIHILPNISRSKGDQTMKFGKLIEYKK